jgi:murein DD-endopeptidase MepM/ murein hydrolase activator NlpD
MPRRRGSWWPALLGVLALIAGVTPLDAVTRQDRMRPPAVTTLNTLGSPWPVRGPINSDYGAGRRSWRRHRVHTGIDIGAPHGTTVRAPATGRVVSAGWRSGYGRTIVIDHGNRVHTLYTHLAKVGVRRGQLIKSGSAIGSSGSTGYVTGPHLHYEVLVNGRPRNPRNYLIDSRHTR